MNKKDNDIAYAGFFITKSDMRWNNFAGMVLMVGIQGSFTFEQIKEYIFESFHSIDLNSIPKTSGKIREDMELYFSF